MTAPGASVEDMLREVIALLAGACEDERERGLHIARPGRVAYRVRTAGSARADAIDLARAVQSGTAAGADALLLARRTRAQWQELALVLAASADLEHLTAAGSLERDRAA